MAEYEIEKRECKPVNFFAGTYPTLTESGVAAGTIEERMPVVKNEDGKIAAVTSATVNNITGIAATNAAENDPCVYYLTGEFFADALVLPEDVTAEAIKDKLRTLNIFLR